MNQLQCELDDAATVIENRYLAFPYLYCNLARLEEAVQIALSQV